MKHESGVEVLICGAGAAGLTLAIDLARRGVSFRLIDKLAGPFEGSRGKGVQPRTLEVFEDLGIIDRIAAAGAFYPRARKYRDDGGFDEAHTFVLEPPKAEEPYRTPLLVPQFRTEAVMRDRLAELGHQPQYGCELEHFDQSTDGVTAQVATPSGSVVIRCRYLVGADGGRSFVRDALGIGFPGKTLGIRAIVADLILDGIDRSAWHRFNEGAQSISLCPLPNSDLFQLQAPIPLEGDVDLSVAGLQAFVDSRVGARLTVRSVAWASAYTMNARLADSYRVDRVFLVGDAAHVHPPTGGQGLNTSIQDAYNLAWKLAAVIAGAPHSLLDTYQEERRPIAAATLGLSTDLLEKARQGDLRRGREVHELDLGYPGSSLSLERPERLGGLRAGDRVPDAVLLGAGGQRRRLFDLLHGPHWTLVACGSTAEALPAPQPDLHIHVIGDGGDVRDLEDRFVTACGLRVGDALLVRPDGYVGAIVARNQRAALLPYLAALRRAPEPT